MKDTRELKLLFISLAVSFAMGAAAATVLLQKKKKAVEEENAEMQSAFNFLSGFDHNI